MLKYLKYFFAIFFLVAIFYTIILLIWGIQSKPLVVNNQDLTTREAGKIKRLIITIDPRKMQKDEVKHIQLSESELNSILSYAANRVFWDIAAQVDIHPGRFDIDASLKLPDELTGNYLNVQLDFTGRGIENMDVASLKLGAVPLPAFAFKPFLLLFHPILMRNGNYQLLTDVIQSIQDIEFGKDQLKVEYQHDPENLLRTRRQISGTLLTKAEIERLRAYNAHILDYSTSHRKTNAGIPVYNFLRNLFELAKERTAKSGKAVEENRAVLIVLAAYSHGSSLEKWVGTGPEKPRIPHHRLMLRGRGDLSKHFLISAGITAAAGSDLANFAGVFKEMNDSRGGSGFSFPDLTADRAGVLFAELALDSRKARVLQESMSAISHEEIFMPTIDHLPEGLQEVDFNRIYKKENSYEYNRVIAEIDRRIQKCSIYQK
ncbi:MAG: hypothetical protein DWQ10_18800 [Calditrichaeota bacterium]|nr:MAG: hypothetical protein DWQ10_18800 [Calditrichota bacterium]